MTDKTPFLNGMPELQADGKLTPSVLYTTEAEESKKKSEEELNVPDPDSEEAAKIIQANIVDENQKK